jgi:hypothetical protein
MSDKHTHLLGKQGLVPVRHSLKQDGTTLLQTSTPRLSRGAKHGKNVVTIHSHSIDTISRTAGCDAITVVLFGAGRANRKSVIPRNEQSGCRDCRCQEKSSMKI